MSQASSSSPFVESVPDAVLSELDGHQTQISRLSLTSEKDKPSERHNTVDTSREGYSPDADITAIILQMGDISQSEAGPSTSQSQLGDSRDATPAPITKRSRNRGGITILSSRTTRSAHRQAAESSSTYYPLGPRHLEHEYTLAWNDLRGATFQAALRLGYKPPRPRCTPEEKAEADRMKPSVEVILARKFADVEDARRRVDEADKKLQEALDRGETWENTPWPDSDIFYDADGNIVDLVDSSRSVSPTVTGSSTPDPQPNKEKGRGKAAEGKYREQSSDSSSTAVGSENSTNRKGKRKAPQEDTDVSDGEDASKLATRSRRRTKREETGTVESLANTSSANVEVNSRREGLRPRRTQPSRKC